MEQTIDSLMTEAIQGSLEAGAAILDVYKTTIEVELKDDRSPLTKADQQAHEAIKARLENLGLPILSEEGKHLSFEERQHWGQFWMVDPLDGTKEFIKKNGEFTVNIALIDNGKPIAGVIYVPVKEVLYFSYNEQAYKVSGIAPEQASTVTLEGLKSEGTPLPAPLTDEVYRVVGSRSHMSPETTEFIEDIKKRHEQVEMVSMGSSLKICLVAEGAAQVYPRFAPTMEWDTAAGQAIAEAAGKQVVVHPEGNPMRYNKENLLNPWFIVS